MAIKKSTLYIFIFPVLLAASLVAANSAAAQQGCPANTSVNGTTVTFVGELSDMGGDTSSAVWFEYGPDTNYGQKTSEMTLTQTGLFCTNVSGLSPCTTYHYRAGARNSAGSSYGEDKTFTITCSQPTVDLKANGSDGQITIPFNTSVTLTWTSNNANTCSASGGWSGTKALSGSESEGNLTSSQTYTLTCTGSGGTASDSVTVNVGSASFSVLLSASPSSGCAPLNSVNLTATVSGNTTGQFSYYFDCTNDGAWDSIVTSNSNSYTASGLCNYSSAGIYTARARVDSQGFSDTETTSINVSSCFSSLPTVNLQANGTENFLTIPFNTPVTLNWTSSNANYCSASGGWSGTKAVSGSEFEGNLTTSQTYTLTCTGSGGTASDSVTVNVGSGQGTLTINKLVRNLSNGTPFLDSVSASPLDVVSFQIQMTAGNSLFQGVFLRDTLPSGIINVRNLRMDGVVVYGDITAGLTIGNLFSGQTRTVTFDADVAGASSFVFGQTTLTNTALASGSNVSGSDTAVVVVTRKSVAGATTVPTGLTNNLLVDSFVLPLGLAFLLVWIFRARIFRFEQWLDLRKQKYQGYLSNRTLNSKIKKIKAREWMLK